MKITLDLDKKQFERLLRIAYLGDWMINAHRDEPLEEYSDLQDLIFSFAKQFGLEKYVTHEPEDGTRYYPSRMFEEETDTNKFHNEYDEETFWDELVQRLTRRDLLNKYSEKAIKEMSQDQYFGELTNYEKCWADEVNEYGINRLEIMKDDIFIFNNKN